MMRRDSPLQRTSETMATAFVAVGWRTNLGGTGRAPFPRKRGAGYGRKCEIRAANVLVLNCGSGGHAFLGAHLSEALIKAGHSVEVRHDGESAPTSVKELYEEIDVKVGYGSISDATFTTSFDVVYDNYSKAASDVSIALKAAAGNAPVHYVSSAGAYTAREFGILPSRVGDAAAGKTIDAEAALAEAGVAGASFRPIYMYGRGSAKRAYLDFFFDRIVRGRPVYIPGTGAELTSLTDVRDVAAMMASALGRPLKRDVFNAVSPRTVSFDGVAQLVGSVVGREAIVRHYDPEGATNRVSGYNLKKEFPFRVRHFFADPDEATTKLGWTATYSGDIKSLLAGFADAYEEYKRLGLHEKEIKFEMDDAIAADIL